MSMKYRNIKTGHTMIFSTRIMSEEWEPVIEQVPVFSVLEVVEENHEVAPVQQKKTTRKKKAEE